MHLDTLRRTVRLALLCCLFAAPAGAASISGVVFQDRNADGLQDPDENPIQGVTVRIVGTADGSGAVFDETTTDATGFYILEPPDGCYFVEVVPPADARIGPARTDCPGDTPEPFPVQERRRGTLTSLVEDVQAGGLLHYALGDSIAAGVSFCIFDDTNYHDDVHQDRTQCVLPAAQLSNNAVGGHTTEHLLRDPAVAGDGNTVEDAVSSGADLVSISIGGNDFLDVDPGRVVPPTQADADALAACASRALRSMRANGQEILSSLVAGLPESDVEINTVYDNFGFSCDSTEFHNRWVPLGNEILRNLAWGQARRVGVAEVWPDYAHLDVQGTTCCGLEGLICTADEIHPDADGRQVHENRFWESLGGVLLGPRDDLGSSVQVSDFGVLERVDMRRASVVRDESTAGGVNDGRVLDGANDQGAVVRTSGGSFYAEGFDALPRGIDLDRAVVGIRYRGTGTYQDDLYWFEASFDPAFPAPGETIDTWNTVIPLVGGSEEAWRIDTGTSPWSCDPRQQPDGTRILVDPAASGWRVVTAMLTKDLEDTDPASGRYIWPEVDFGDLSTLSVRLRSRAVGTPDDFSIEWDDVWVDLYGAVSSGPLLTATKEALDAATSEIVSEARVRQAITYRIVVENAGTAVASSVELEDTLPGCMSFLAGPYLDGAPVGTFSGGLITVPMGDVAAGARHEITFNVEVTPDCAGTAPIDNVARITSQENPSGITTDDPSTPTSGDPTSILIESFPLFTEWSPGLLRDPTPGDPFDCGALRLEPGVHSCDACVTEAPGGWSLAGVRAPDGVRDLQLFEVPRDGCPTAGDATVLCVTSDPATDVLRLELRPAAGGCS